MKGPSDDWVDEVVHLESAKAILHGNGPGGDLYASSIDTKHILSIYTHLVIASLYQSTTQQPLTTTLLMYAGANF